MEFNQYDLDYVKAAIETLDLIEFFLSRLNTKHLLDKFVSFLQAFIERSKQDPKSDIYPDIPSSDSLKDVRSATKYWEGVCDTLIFLKAQGEKLPDSQPFLKVLRERRDSYSLTILSDAISPLDDIVARFFFIPILDTPLDQLFASEEEEKEENELLSLALRKALQVLREEEEKIDLPS